MRIIIEIPDIDGSVDYIQTMVRQAGAALAEEVRQNCEQGFKGVPALQKLISDTGFFAHQLKMAQVDVEKTVYKCWRCKDSYVFMGDPCTCLTPKRTKEV